MSFNPLQTFQKNAGVKPDGAFGPKTLRAGIEFLHLNNISGVHFFAQCAHETAGFKYFEEKLGYSEKGLKKYFSKYFSTEEEFKSYARNPEKIASRVYGNRMGNGDEESGEGWKYRGRGAIQLTGKNNYTEFSMYEGKDFVQNPDLVKTDYSFESAQFFFERNNLLKYCVDLSENSVRNLTKRINGGYNGLNHRIELTEKYSKWI